MEQLSDAHSKTDIVIANKWPLGNDQYIDQIEALFDPSLLLMAHHSGAGDDIVRKNRGLELMEEKMSRTGMKGRIFERRTQCANF